MLYIFLEVLRDSVNNANHLKRVNILQNVILFLGFLIDWLFVFIALTTYIKRIISKEILLSKNITLFLKKSLYFWSVPIIALSLFASQIIYYGAINGTLSRALLRTGTVSDPINRFLGYINAGYGKIAVPALLISIYIFIVISLLIYYKSCKKQKVDYNVDKVKKTLYLIGMLIIPCLLQLIVFKQHSVFHDFSVLKLSVPFATIPFVLIPILLFLMYEKSVLTNFKSKFNILKHNNLDFRLFIIFLIVFTASTSYIIYEHHQYTNLFPPNNDSFKIIGDSIQKNTGYNDVVLSPDFKIDIYTPQQLAYSMKRVYLITNSTESIDEQIQNLNLKGDYTIVLMFLNLPSNYWTRILSNITPIKDGTITYYKINHNSIK